MLNATFEMFILHYIMEYVGNLCIPCPLHEQPKKRIYNFWLHKTITRVPYGFIMRGKYFVGNCSACVITNSEHL